MSEKTNLWIVQVEKGWLVRKKPKSGDPYTIAFYREEQDAKRLLKQMRRGERYDCARS